MNELDLNVNLETEVIQRVLQAHHVCRALSGLRHRVGGGEPRLSGLVAEVLDYVFAAGLERPGSQLGNDLARWVPLETLTVEHFIFRAQQT